jgi:sugar transferase (PEP-CTERM system associated)
MNSGERHAEHNFAGYGGIASDLMSGGNHVIPFSRTRKKDERTGGVTVEFPKYRWLLLLGDLTVVTLANVLSAWIRFLPSDSIAVHTVVFAITLGIYPATLYVFDLYNGERSFCSWETAYRSALAVLFGGSLSTLVFYLLPYGSFHRGSMTIQMGLVWVLLNGWRWSFRAVFQTMMPRIPVLILGAGHCGRTMYELLKSSFSPYEVKAFLDDDPQKVGTSFSPTVMGTCDQLVEVADRVGAHTAILAIPKNRSAELVRNVLDGRLKGISIQDMADVYEQLTGRVPVHSIGDEWLLFTKGFLLLHTAYIQKLKRLMDCVASGFILLLIVPLIGLAALAIRMDSPGPIFYSQKRVGKGRRVFTLYKFRSMRSDAEAGGARWAAVKDSRVTRVGRILRLTHLDEIPQIWNIFKGDMSLVGPRPERPEFVQVLEKEVPYYFARHSVRPGLTGWAQINYSYGASLEDAKNKLEYDIYYVKNMSLMLDLEILLRTIGVVLLSDGAR